MKIRSILSMIRNQKGFTLPELLVGIAIMGAISGVGTTTIVQMNHGVIENRNHISAVNQVHNAGYWIQVDTKMAQNVEVGATDSGLPLALSWVDWNNTSHRIIYTVVDDQLLRGHLVNGVGSGTITAASSIVSGSPSTSCSFVDTDDPPDGNGNVLVFTLTATDGSGTSASSETREFRYEPRTT